MTRSGKAAGVEIKNCLASAPEWNRWGHGHAHTDRGSLAVAEAVSRGCSGTAVMNGQVFLAFPVAELCCETLKGMARIPSDKGITTKCFRSLDRPVDVFLKRLEGIQFVRSR
jgi:hypothetical protein